MPIVETLALVQDTARTGSGPLAPPLALAAATVVSGLSAGVFYAYQTSVTRALAVVDDTAYVATFQAINRKIQNGWFAAVFAGAPILIGAALATHWGERTSLVSLVGAGFALHLANLAVTVFGNIPLNQQLDRLGPVSGAAATAARDRFERPWNRLHLARTVLAVASVVALGAATLLAARG